MVEEIWIPDKIPLLLKFDKLSASTKNGRGYLNTRYKTYTDKIWKTKGEFNKYGRQNFNYRYKTYTVIIWQIMCKYKKNGGGDLNPRKKTYTDKIWQIKFKHEQNGGWFYSQINSLYRWNIKIESKQLKNGGGDLNSR